MRSTLVCHQSGVAPKATPLCLPSPYCYNSHCTRAMQPRQKDHESVKIFHRTVLPMHVYSSRGRLCSLYVNTQYTYQHQETTKWEYSNVLRAVAIKPLTTRPRRDGSVEHGGRGGGSLASYTGNADSICCPTLSTSTTMKSIWHVTLYFMQNE